MRDFTIKQYKHLLRSIISQGYSFQTFEQFIEKPEKKVAILRHDVDLLPQNSLNFARIQSEMGVRGTYYFRAVSESWNELVINEIHSLGHEVGYHYENLTTCEGNMRMAIEDFNDNLKNLRKLVPVKTICMHGSPRSPFDSKKLWEENTYRDYGIIGEPYFDLNFSEVYYLTDTGRRWNGDKVSVRDKVSGTHFNNLNFQHSKEIISALENGLLPDKIMFTFHPQRWSNNPFYWTKELVWQNIKNIIKKHFFVKKGWRV
jgi:hypothetical protein